MPIFRILFLASAATLAGQNIITTFAGAPKLFSSGTPALTAPVAPSRIAVGPKGAIYFGDREANVVLRLNSDGTLTVVAGNGIAGFSGDGGPATQASLDQPSGFAADNQGNLYIADVLNSRVRKVDTNGKITTVAGNGQSGFSGDGGLATNAQIEFTGTYTTGGHTPAQYGGNIAVDSAGDLYITDEISGRVRKVDLNGIITTVAGGGAASPGDGGQATQANINVSDVAVDAAGNIYIACSCFGGTASVKKVTPGGIITTFDPSSGITSLAVDSTGKLYASTLNGQILLITGNSAPIVLAGGGTASPGDGGPATSALLNNPFGVAVDAQGNILIAETFGERIRKVAPGGVITTVAGTGSPNFFGDGGPARSAGLSAPNSLAVNAAGTVYIADTNNKRIRAVDAHGVITTFFDFSSTNGNPTEIALSPDGGLFVNGVPAGPGAALVKVFGDGTSKPVNTGTLNVVSFNADAAGNLFVVDGNLALRKIDTSGNVSAPVPGVAVRCQTFLHQCVATDPSGNAYVPGGAGVVKVTPSGTVSAIPVSGASAISGIAVDSAGNIYLSDVGNHDQILKVTPDGTTAPYAGNNGFGFSGDGGPALQATLFDPVGLAVDTASNLYIADNLNGRIRKVLASTTSVSYTVTPASLPVLQGTSGGAKPAIQTLTLTPDIAGLAFSVTTDSPWLTVTPSSGAMPATLQVTADPSQLPAGTYRGTVAILAPNATSPTSTFILNFSVAPAVVGRLTVSSPGVSFSLTKGAGSATSSLTLSNQGSGTIGFAALATTQNGGNWLQVSPTQGTVTAGQPVPLAITAAPGSLDVGTYSGTIILASADTGQQISVPVTLAISAPPQKILLSQSGLSFTAVAQGGMPLPQTFGILNTGQGSMSWTASTSTFSGGSGWLNLSPSSGVVQRPFLDVSFVSVTINPAGLSAGTYYGQIQVASTGAANSPQTITVVLTVLPAGSNPGPEVRPTGLIFTGIAGSSPSSQDVVIGNPSGQSINYESGQIGTAFSFLPANATVDPTQPTAVHVYPNFSALAPGTIQRGTVTLQFTPDGTPRTISVLTVVAPSGSSSTATGDAARLASACPTVLYPQFTQLGSGSALQAGFPGIVGVKVVDDCGNPLTTGSVVASFSDGTPPLSLNNLQNGQWEIDWEPRGGSSNGVLVTVNAQVPGTSLTGTISATVGVQGNSTLPSLSNQPLSAVTLSQGPLAPGDIILLQGTALADGKASASPGSPALQLAGTSLLINGNTTPLLYADAGQVVGVVPANVPVDTSVAITFLRDSVPGIPSSVVISSVHPSILTKDGSGAGQGLIYKAGPPLTLADSSAPVKSGDSIVIYCAGLGLVNQQGVAQNIPTVTIGGQTAQVTYAGSALASTYPSGGAPTILGGLVSAALGGLYQINAIVPAGVSGGAALVMLSSMGQNSQAGVTLAIAGPIASGPVITSVNTAYGSADIGQNDFIEIHGTNLAAAAAGPSSLATQLGGVSVTVDGKPALLYYVSPAQINALTPLDSSLGPVPVVVTSNGVPSPSYTANLRTVTPAFLRFDSAGHITATHADGTLLGPTSLGTAFTPAHAGDTIVTYAVGFGLPSTAVVSGSPTQTGALPTLPVCQISGTPAPVAFAGLNGFAGLFQLNIVVPGSVANGDNPISCTYGGQATPAGTLLSIQN